MIKCTVTNEVVAIPISFKVYTDGVIVVVKIRDNQLTFIDSDFKWAYHHNWIEKVYKL